MDITRIYCEIDDILKDFSWSSEGFLIDEGKAFRNRACALSASEMITILILFHQSSGYRNFKGYYTGYVCRYSRREFPELLSYNRFIQLLPRLLQPILACIQTRKGTGTGLQFIDSTSLKVCHNKRINRHRVFTGIAGRGKSSMGWFFGLKLHLVINEAGELLGIAVTPGNTDDRRPVEQITQGLTGKLFGDKGYISQELFEKLKQRNLQLITNIRKNMKPRVLPLFDKVMLRKRFLIETVNDMLKNVAHIEHSRHRSPINSFVHLIAGLMAYTYFEKHPSINLSDKEREIMQQVLGPKNSNQVLIA